MKAKSIFLIALSAAILSSCSTAPKQAALPGVPETAKDYQNANKPSRTEIEIKIAQELKRLGETQLAEEERRVASGQKDEITYDIPITINAQVERWIEYFQTRIPKRFQLWLSRSGRYDKLMRGILKEYGLPEDLFYLAMIESGFSCNAYSRAHAVGPWQFIRGTGRRYKLKIDYWVDERRDPVKSTHAAAQYLKDLYQEFGSWYLAAAAYNAGEAKIRKALKRYKADDFWAISHHGRSYLKNETKNYVPKMIAAALIAKEPEKYGFKDITLEEPMVFDSVKVNAGTSLGVAAKMAGIKTQHLAALNPELRRWCTPPNRGGYTLRIPLGTKAAFETAYASLPQTERKARIGTISVTVQKGDTLGRIASTYKVPLSDLLALNPNLDPRRLKVGQSLQIPPGGGEPSTVVAEASAPRPQRAKVRSYAASNPGTRKIIHVVKRGDTIWDIAQSYGINHKDIRRWNGRRSTRLAVGSKLVLYVPQAKAEAKLESSSGKNLVYVVQQGDNLWEISRRFKTTPAAIRRWNNMSTSRITPGDRLTVRLADNNS